jgi:hypothetical protein
VAVRQTFLSCLTLALLLLKTSPADQPHYYMLLEPGNERWYHGTSMSGTVVIHSVVTHMVGDVSVRRMERISPYPMVWAEAWHIDATGDVWSCSSEDHSVRSLFLDLPLTPGKTWGEDWGPMGYHTYTVGPEVVVSTIFGDLTCSQVNWAHWDPGYPTEHNGYYRFHDGYGFIEFLYLDGYHVFQHYGIHEAVIGIQQRSWSQIKQLFR